jgi:hypothetical protein
MCWNPSPHNIFEVKTYYNVLQSGTVQTFSWKVVWKLKNPSKVSFFLWTAALGKVLTTDNLRKRQLIMLLIGVVCASEMVNLLTTSSSTVQWRENYGT